MSAHYYSPEFNGTHSHDRDSDIHAHLISTLIQIRHVLMAIHKNVSDGDSDEHNVPKSFILNSPSTLSDSL